VIFQERLDLIVLITGLYIQHIFSSGVELSVFWKKSGGHHFMAIGVAASADIKGYGLGGYIVGSRFVIAG
jgi:hypothetical protein